MEDVYIIILSIFILMLLVLLTSFILKKLVIDVNNEAKKKYLLNILKYNEEIKEIPEDKKDNSLPKVLNDNKIFNDDAKIYISDVQYKKEGILKQAKKIESKFNLDNETIIKYFLEHYLGTEDYNTYLDLVNEHKLKAQEAREVLPLGTKTMLMHCAFKSDWLDFIRLRKSPAAHPDAYKLAAEVEKFLNNKI